MHACLGSCRERNVVCLCQLAKRQNTRRDLSFRAAGKKAHFLSLFSLLSCQQATLILSTASQALPLSQPATNNPIIIDSSTGMRPDVDHTYPLFPPGRQHAGTGITAICTPRRWRRYSLGPPGHRGIQRPKGRLPCQSECIHAVAWELPRI